MRGGNIEGCAQEGERVWLLSVLGSLELSDSAVEEEKTIAIVEL